MFTIEELAVMVLALVLLVLLVLALGQTAVLIARDKMERHLAARAARQRIADRMNAGE